MSSSYYADKVSEILNNNTADWEAVILKSLSRKTQEGGGEAMSENHQAKITPVELQTILQNYCPGNSPGSSPGNKVQAITTTKSILKGKEDASLNHNNKRVSLYCAQENKHI